MTTRTAASTLALATTLLLPSGAAAQVKTGPVAGLQARLRAGPEQAGDDGRRIHSGSAPTFSQTTRSGRTVARRPRYRVTMTS